MPRIVLVDENEAGVMLRGGKYHKNVGPGCHFCLPYFDEIVETDVTRQIINLPNQTATTKDGCTVGASGVVEYSVGNARKSILECQDFDESLQNMTMQAIFSFLCRMEWEKRDTKALVSHVYDTIEQGAEAYGLDILDFSLTDLCKQKAIRLVQAE